MKKRLLVSICVCLLLILFLGIGVSYSLWNISVSEDKINTAMTSCFDITYSSESEAINLEKQYPISDEVGSKLEPYTFKITNNCDISAYYKINLETLSSSNIDTKFMKASLNNENSKTISNYETAEVSLKNSKVANILKSGYLPVGGSVTFDLRLWIDYDTTVDDIKNDGTDKWVGKIVVVSSPVTEDEINKVCQNRGGDLIDSGECRKYYVKLNNLSNPYSSNGYKLIKNDDLTYIASTDGLDGSESDSSLRIMVSKNNFVPLNKYFYSINFLNMLKRFDTKTGNPVEITRYTYYDNNNIWPRLNVISSLDKIGRYTSIFTANINAEQVYLESYSWTEFSFKNSSLINLTLMFGEGNEPNKEWCDKYLDTFIEYNTEGTLVPIKEVGEPIKTSYYDVIDLF